MKVLWFLLLLATYLSLKNKIWPWTTYTAVTDKLSVELRCLLQHMLPPARQRGTQYNEEVLNTTCGRDRIVVSTLRCGRSNPGSNPGHGSVDKLFFFYVVALR